VISSSRWSDRFLAEPLLADSIVGQVGWSFARLIIGAPDRFESCGFRAAFPALFSDSFSNEEVEAKT